MWDGRNAGVVELVVREQRSVMALRAVGFAREQFQSRHFVRRQDVLGRTAGPRERFHIGVKPRRPILHSPLVGGDGFPDVYEHSGRFLARGQLWHHAEDLLVVGAIVICDDLGVLLARSAMLDGTLEGTKSLRPLAVLSAVPEEERTVGGAGNRHGATVRHSNAICERRAVLEFLIRLVTRRARDAP